MADKKIWTNKEVLDTFLRYILSGIDTHAFQAAEWSHNSGLIENPEKIKQEIMNYELVGVLRVFGLIDGVIGPTTWPGVKLVNAETGEDLSDDLAWDMSAAEKKYLESLGKERSD
jgi:hypothetical protein